jgi:PAS domain S-box-containing protein
VTDEREDSTSGLDLPENGHGALIESLRQSEEHFDRLVDAVRDYAIFLLDPKGRVVSWNAGAREITGYEAHEIIGRQFSVFYPREDVARGWPQGELATAAAEGRFEDEGWRVRKDGSRFWGNTIITRLLDDSGVLRGFMKITRDLTERRLADERLRRAHDDLELRVKERTAELERANERLRESERRLGLADQRKDQFLAVLSHELRNPLAPVRTAIEIVRRIDPADPRIRKAMAVLDRQVAHMTHLVDDLLDVSRITRGKLHIAHDRLDLRELVRAVVEDHRASSEQRGVSLDHDLPASALFVEGDDTRLSQAIGNIITNAIKFTEPGGHIRVRLANESGWASIAVRDSGAGIRPELIDQVFEPFTQGEDVVRQHGGLGLGLALVRGLIELHGGSVAVASAGEQQGTTFTLLLPIVADAEARGDESLAPVRTRTPRTVLIVEDNVDAAETMAMFLSTVGHRVEIAHSGAKGIAIAERLRPEVVICDIGLTDMSGLDVARRLRGSLPSAYLLALTGYGQEEDRRQSREAGFDMHATKPMDMGTLDAIVANLGPVAPAPSRAR